MAFAYDTAPTIGSLRQGLLLGPVWEHRPLVPPVELADPNVEVRSVRHALMIVMTPDCDLIWDFQVRFGSDEAQRNLSPEAVDIDESPSAVPHVLLCETYGRDDIRARFDSKLFGLAAKNRDERYHHFPTALVGEEGHEQPEVFIDFKKPLAVPTTLMYAGVRDGGLRRIAWIPLVHRHDLIHRFYGFQSRVAVPAD